MLGEGEVVVKSRFIFSFYKTKEWAIYFFGSILLGVLPLGYAFKLKGDRINKYNKMI
jgi:hypothetical protein